MPEVTAAAGAEVGLEILIYMRTHVLPPSMDRSKLLYVELLAEPAVEEQLPVVFPIHLINLYLVGTLQDRFLGPIPTLELRGLVGAPVIPEAQEALGQQVM